MNEPKQRELPFRQPKETKEERCQRILSGRMGHKLKRASALRFDEGAARRADRLAKAFVAREKALAD